MTLCACGNPAAVHSTFCPRCAALQVLDLPATAGDTDVKAAYLVLVKVWHPDRFPSDPKLRQAAEDKLKAINSAYEFLTSPSQPDPSASQLETSSARPQPAADFKAPRRPPTRPPSRLPARLLGSLQPFLIAAAVIAVAAALVYILNARQSAKPSSVSSTLTQPPPPPPSEPEPPPASRPQPSALGASSAASPTKAASVLPHLQPFITTGLTRDEVIAAAGPPESETADKLLFKGAEINFKNGQVSGWKIDTSVSSIRVKLWPNPQTDRTLTVFSVDSTKDDVLVVQGTPTTLTDNLFGYGSSEIYFRNNRVVSWKDDPASVLLRAVSR